MHKGFTLIEVLVAIFIITVGAGGALALIQKTLSFTSNAALQLEASYLAQEGMEIVRNIRDTNFVKIHKGVEGSIWTNGLEGCEAGCQADYTQDSLIAYEDTLLQLTNGIYSYTVSTDSLFKRKITITMQGSDMMEAVVEVMWEERGRNHVVSAATELYNWLSPTIAVTPTPVPISTSTPTPTPSLTPEPTPSPTPTPTPTPSPTPEPTPSPTPTPTPTPSPTPTPTPTPSPTPEPAPTPLGPPDITISSFTLNKSDYSPGETATATLTITNLGESDSSAFNTHLYSDASSNPECNASGGIDHWTPYNFSPSSSDSWSINFQVAMLEGSYTARIFADMGCAITESDENNNYLAVTYGVLSPPPPLAISIPVLVLKYFPEQNGNLDLEITGINDSLVSIRTKVNQLTGDIVNSLTTGSTYHGYKDPTATSSLQYSVLENKEFLKQKPVSINAIPWNPSVFRPDYNLMLTDDVSICNYVDNLGVKEVWVWGYHFGNIEPVESNMAMGTTSQGQWNHGTYGDVSNSEQIDDLPTCAQSYTLYNYNYGRGLAEALENHGHHIESIFKFVDETLWNKFQFPHGETAPTVNSCGWTHAGPNSTEQYESGWTSEAIVKSNCEDWHPDGSGEVKDVSCHTWYGATCVANGGVEFKEWWMQNIPGKTNGLLYLGNQMRDWWEFIGDFDDALSKGKSLTL